MSTEVLQRLNSWLDNWLDQGSFQGQVAIRHRETDGDRFELRIGEEWQFVSVESVAAQHAGMSILVDSPRNSNVYAPESVDSSESVTSKPWTTHPPMTLWTRPNIHWHCLHGYLHRPR